MTAQVSEGGPPWGWGQGAGSLDLPKANRASRISHVRGKEQPLSILT